jgi:AcrR family transcriptional regulator
VSIRTKAVAEGNNVERVLQTAEALFAAKGVDKVSLRELTAKAGVNLAAVNYHFGSKEALSEAVFERLSKRVNDQRRKDLEDYLSQAAAKGEPPKLEDIVESFVRPYLSSEEHDHAHLLSRFILQHRLAPSPMTRRIIKKHFDPMAKRYIEALAKACPNVDAAEFFWRYMFMVSTVVLTMTDYSGDNRLHRLSKGAVDATKPDELRAALMRFLVGGLSAPSATRSAPKSA